MNRREILKAVAFVCLGIIAGGYAVAYLWWNAFPAPKTEAAKQVAVKASGKAISREAFEQTLRIKGTDELTKLAGAPDKIGPAVGPNMGACWIYLRRTYAKDLSKLDASAYVFFFFNGGIESVIFHDE